MVKIGWAVSRSFFINLFISRNEYCVGLDGSFIYLKIL